MNETESGSISEVDAGRGPPAAAGQAGEAPATRPPPDAADGPSCEAPDMPEGADAVVRGARHHPRVRPGRRRRARPARRRRRPGARSADRDHGPVGLRQVDAHAHPRRPRRADVGHGHRRRRRDHGSQGARAHAAAPRQDRLHLPDLQPVADAHGAGEHRPAGDDRRPQERRAVGRPAGRHGRPRPIASPTSRRSSPAASSSASPWPAPSSAAPRCSSPTSRRATSTPRPATRSSTCCGTRSTTSARPSSWSPTTPTPRPIADRLLFLKDGEIVHDCGRMARDEIYEVIKSLEDAR